MRYGMDSRAYRDAEVAAEMRRDLQDDDDDLADLEDQIDSANEHLAHGYDEFWAKVRSRATVRILKRNIAMRRRLYPLDGVTLSKLEAELKSVEQTAAIQQPMANAAE